MFSSTKIMQALSPAGAAASYQIARSLRFNSADSAYLSRTPASAGNRKTWTLSLWLKRSTLGAVNNFSGSMNAGGTTGTEFFFSSGDLLTFDEYVSSSLQFNLTTTQVFRDVSAWYNIVFAVDTTQATASNRIKIYVNGTQVTAFGTATYPTQNLDTQFNFTSAMAFGRNGSFTSGYFNGYMADIYFIDGQALTPSSFGETDSATGVWVPKAYTGTYGTNGFWLKFDDNSGTTSTTLGKDSSGNGNNWTPNNFSVTAGVGNDSLVDSPTNYGTDTGAGGEVRGNYCTVNPLDIGGLTVANGNLDVTRTSSTADWDTGRCTIQIPDSGKWYWEMTFNSGSNDGCFVGVGTSSAALSQETNGFWAYQSAGYIIYNGSFTTATALSTGDVVMVAFDRGANKMWFGRNGTWGLNGGSPVTPTDPNSNFTNLPANLFPAVGIRSTANASYNFGQRPFAYTAPSGFKALCTQNLPTPTIGTSSTTLADDYFNIALYTGTGANLSVTGIGFQPDFVWIKGRSGATDHGLYDAVRGVQKQLESNTTTAETTETTGLTAFGTDGFTVGTLAQLNTNTATYVGWAWKANGAGSSNTAGSITSTVSANQTAGISVVTYTIPSASATIETFGHGLGRAPSMVILKVRGNVDEWTVYNANLTTPLSNWLTLNTTAAAGGATSTFSSSSTTFGVRGTRLLGSGTSGNIVAYCFAEIAGFSRFGSYTGNGSTDGPFVYCGFRPRFVLIKSSSDGTAGNDWVIIDTARNTFNESAKFLRPNLSNAEGDDAGTSPAISIDILSNGFKVRGTSARINTSSSTYIFAVFAESPFNYSRAR